ncbi:MAG: hypothetical protein H7281_17755 [Bacteriovorax sp.]|nr:hypothetical protein [Bacteriovorax sp.]
MNKTFLIFAISILLVSCGQKNESSKAKFKIFSGNITNGPSQFTGGLLILGRSLDNSQSFSVLYKDGLELELNKGSWEFSTIGWMGTNPMEGIQQCDHQSVEINSSIFNISFSMTPDKCVTSQTSDGKSFTDSIYYSNGINSYTGFKKLIVKTCATGTLGSCGSMSQSSPGSFRIEIPASLTGINLSGIGSGLASNCILGTLTSNVSPPYGGHGFIGLKITTFTDTACSATPKNYYFNHGFGEILNKTYIDNGVNVTRKGALSIDTGITSQTLNPLDLITYKGAYNITASAPASPSNGDIYFYNGVVNTTFVNASLSPYVQAVPGNYFYYCINGSAGWKSATENVKLILED